jgi:hypothetical protein
MARLRRPVLSAVLLPAGLVMLAGCTSSSQFGSGFGGFSNPFSSSSPPPPAAPAMAAIPPSVRPEDIVGRYGLAAYHREQDRVRTEAAARGQCTQPYLINRSASGGVSMLGHDNPQFQDMQLKGSVEGKTYVGPGADPGGADDREVVSFDGRVLILRWVDPEVAGRYGNYLLVRCGAEGTARTARAKKPAPATQAQ